MATRLQQSVILFDIKAFEFEKEKVEEEIKKEAARVKELYNTHKKDISGNHKLIAKTGIIPEEILKKIREVDLVIMGKRIKKDEKGKLQSNVFSIIKKSNKPVIAVSKGETLGSNFLLAYNKSRSANNALKVMGEFIDYLNPDLSILTLSNNREEAEELLSEAEKYFFYYNVEIEKIWKKESKLSGIIKTIEEKKISCLVMGGYGDNKIKEFLIGKTAEKVLEKVDIPVIIVNA